MAKKLLLIGFILFSLTGCVKGNVDIEFVDENNATLTIDILFQEDLLESYDTSLTDLKHKLTNSELSNWQNKELNKQINGSNYTGFQLLAPKTINNRLLSFFTTNKKDGTSQVIIDYSTINDIFNTSEIKDINNYSFNKLQSMGLELNLNIKMPGTITTTNYGKIKNNQVTVNLLEFITQKETTAITITSSNQNKTSRPVNLLIFITLIIVLYIILRKRH